MDNLKIFKEQQINNYISSLHLTKDTIKLSTIKKELRLLIGEEPAIMLNYKKESYLKEDGSGDIVDIDILESMSIIYTTTIKDDNGYDILVPITQEILLN